MACDTGVPKTPSEDELKASGGSLLTALPDFTSLTDNYSYKEKTQQTNGEDWFNYDNVKLNDGNILVRNKFINNNVGWQYEDEVFAEYSDLSNYPYELYTKNSNDNYTFYRKFKTYDTDEDFQKYYYLQSENFTNSEGADRFRFDFSFFESTQFEYKTDIDENSNTIHYWKLKNEFKTDDTFKQIVYDKMYIDKGIDTSEVYLYNICLYVEDNKVTKLFIDCTNGDATPQTFKITIQFDYDNYQFNDNILTEGFTEYIAD